MLRINILRGLLMAAGVVSLSAQAAELRVLTHASFDVDKKLIQEFETQHQAKISIIKAGDAGEMLNKLVLTKSAPIADVVYGVDNILIAKAKAEGVLTTYQSTAAGSLNPAAKLPAELTPVDYGHVALNYDKAWVEKNKLALPKSLNDLTQPAYKDLLVVENPATSSPGLAFLVATVQYFGEPKVWDFWKALRGNGVKVSQGWTDAYMKEFSRNGGTRPIVVSYGTSPAAEVFYSEGKLTVPPTANLFLPGSAFPQVEGAGLVKGGKEPALAKAFVDFLVSDKVQADFPTKMWMFPTRQGVKLPDSFKFAEQPKDSKPVVLTDAKKLQQWVSKWTQVVVHGE